MMAAAAPAQAVRTAGNWSSHAQRIAVGEHMISPLADGRFHGERALTTSQLREVRDALAERVGRAPVSVRTSGTVTVAQFHSLLARQLGFADDARRVQRETARAGLRPPARFGSEVVVRLIELTHAQHMPWNEKLSLYPWSPVTRAEVAWSLYQIAIVPPKEYGFTHDVLSLYALPRYSPAQKRILRRAVARIGMPFIWGGTSDRAAGQAKGGYDCSGFIWRVWKHSGLKAAKKIRARTASGMAGEISMRGRIHREDIQPGDLLFFGERGTADAQFRMKSSPKNIHHSGIAMSRDFGISATYQGVDVQPIFDEWFYDDFAWGRRLLCPFSAPVPPAECSSSPPIGGPPSSAASRPKNSPTFQSMSSRVRRAMPGMSARW